MSIYYLAPELEDEESGILSPDRCHIDELESVPLLHVDLNPSTR